MMLDKSINILTERLAGVQKALDGTRAELSDIQNRLRNVEERAATQETLALDLERAIQLLQNSEGIVNRAGAEE